MAKWKKAAVIVLSGVLLAGCGAEFPTLTQEEYDLIVDYSAGVLSKYTVGNGDKLTRLAPEVPKEGVEAAAAASTRKAPAAAASTAKAEAEEAAAVAETFPEDTAGDDRTETDEAPGGATDDEAEDAGTSASAAATDEAQPTEDAQENDAVITNEEEETPTAVADTDNAVQIGNNDLLQRMQSGLAVDFNGYYVLNSYPDNAAGGTVLTADAGNRLLILSFSLRNETDSSLDINLLGSNPTFTLLLNGQPVSKNLVTVLDNDMSTYLGTLAGGESTGAVLCFQVKESQAKAIDTLSLKMNYRGEEQILRIE